jgi:hypothetical protein
MSIESIPGKGLLLSLKEYKQTRAFSDGGYFLDPQNQQIIRKYLGEFLPGVTIDEGNRPGTFLFNQFDEWHLDLSKSTPVGSRFIPRNLVDNLEQAWENLKKVPNESKPNDPNDPQPQEQAKRIIEEFRLPHPHDNPELYRLSGFPWARKLHILWGCEKLNKEESTSVAPGVAIRALRRTPLAIQWWWVWLLLALLLAGLLWWLFRHAPGAVEPVTVSPPVFSPSPGSYDAPLEVQISSPTPDTEIHFALDSDDPNSPNSFVYTTQVVLLRTTTIHAVAVENGAQSAESSAAYTISDETAQDQDESATKSPEGENDDSEGNQPSTNQTVVPPPIPTPNLSNRLPFEDNGVDSAEVRFLGHPNGDDQAQGWCFINGYLIGGTEKNSLQHIKPGDYEVRVVAWENGKCMTDIQGLKLASGDVAFNNVSAGSIENLLRLKLLREGAVQTAWKHSEAPVSPSNTSDVGGVCAGAIDALRAAANNPGADSRPGLCMVNLPDELGGQRELDPLQLDKTIDWLNQADPSQSSELDSLKTALETRMQDSRVGQ